MNTCFRSSVCNDNNYCSNGDGNSNNDDDDDILHHHNNNNNGHNNNSNHNNCNLLTEGSAASLHVITPLCKKASIKLHVDYISHVYNIYMQNTDAYLHIVSYRICILCNQSDMKGYVLQLLYFYCYLVLCMHVTWLIHIH